MASPILNFRKSFSFSKLSADNNNKNIPLSRNRNISIEITNQNQAKSRQILPIKISKKLINNGIEPNHNQYENHKEIEIMHEISIKNLNIWENEKIIDSDESHEESKINNSLISKNEVETLNFALNTNYAKSFFDKNKPMMNAIENKQDEELGIILLQNISLSKKRFNFEVFNQSNFNEEIKKVDKLKLKSLNYLKEKTNFLGINERVIRNLSFFLDNDYATVLKTDKYREVINHKVRNEIKSRNKLIKLSQDIIEKKRERNRISQEITQLQLKLFSLNEKIKQTVEAYEQEKNSITLIFQNSLTMNQNSTGQEYYILNGFSENSKIFYKKLISIKDDFEMKRVITTQRIEDLDQEKKQMIADLRNEINLVKIKIIELSKQEGIIRREKNQSNYLFKSFSKELRGYYTDILKLGIDVRSEGLVWCVRRLIELRINLDSNLFPKFLDNSQIQYLVNLAQKQIQYQQFILLIKSLKEKQRTFQDESNLFRIKHNTQNLQNTVIGRLHEKKNIFSQNIVKNFDQIFEKYDLITKKTFERILEENQIDGIVKVLKGKINNVKENKNSVEKNKILEKFFSENQKQKECFEEILSLRVKIKLVEKEIEELKENQLQIFRQKYDLHRNSKNCIEYDFIYSALFGNGIIV